LGVSVDGRRGTVGVSISDRLDLIDDTNALITRGVASGRDLSRIVGSWTWVMLVQRPALAVFSVVYKFSVSAGTRAIPLWPSVICELHHACNLAPLLTVSLRSPVLPIIVATDASNGGFGATASHVPIESVRAVAAMSYSSALIGLVATAGSGGVSSRAASALLHTVADSVAPFAPSHPIGPPRSFIYSSQALPCLSGYSGDLSGSLGRTDRNRVIAGLSDPHLYSFRRLNEVVAARPWRVVVSASWSRAGPEESINVKEVRAAYYGLCAMFRACGAAAIGSRFLLFTDSLVALSVMSKGRSSSPQLLRRLRSISALVLGTGIRPFYRYIPTDLNPADDPSRNRRPVGPWIASLGSNSPREPMPGVVHAVGAHAVAGGPTVLVPSPVSVARMYR
jgi:hypothetical protein